MALMRGLSINHRLALMWSKWENRWPFLKPPSRIFFRMNLLLCHTKKKEFLVRWSYHLRDQQLRQINLVIIISWLPRDLVSLTFEPTTNYREKQRFSIFCQMARLCLIFNLARTSIVLFHQGLIIRVTTLEMVRDRSTILSWRTISKEDPQMDL